MRTWEVRPTFVTTETEVVPTGAANVARGLRIQERLLSEGISAPAWELGRSPSGAVTITATLIVEAATAGQAVDIAIEGLLRAFDTEGGTTNGVEKVIVLPYPG